MRRLSILISISTLLGFGCTNEREFPDVKNLSEYTKTEFIPVIEQEIDLKKNQIYCSTFGYAWNELKTITGADLEIDDQKYGLLKLLNDSKGHENSLNPDEINNTVSIEGNIIKSKSEFHKSLPFKYEYERNNREMLFNGQEVETFGFYGYEETLVEQTEVLYYENKDDFGVKLKSEITDHEILLCTSSSIKSNTLKGLWIEFENRIKSRRDKKEDSWRYRFNSQDVLNIPIFSFNLETNYDTLINNKFSNNNEIEFNIATAYQRTALILDEKRAEIESVAEIAMETSEAVVIELPEPKKMIFDRPFLLVFKRTDSDNPYLIVWVANNELIKKKEF